MHASSDRAQLSEGHPFGGIGRRVVPCWANGAQNGRRDRGAAKDQGLCETVFFVGGRSLFFVFCIQHVLRVRVGLVKIYFTRLFPIISSLKVEGIFFSNIKCTRVSSLISNSPTTILNYGGRSIEIFNGYAGQFRMFSRVSSID